MKYLQTFIKLLNLKNIPKPLGRWKIEKCHNKINEKIDLSNEDHCGPCGQYALEKKELIQNPKNKNNTEFQLEKIKIQK